MFFIAAVRFLRRKSVLFLPESNAGGCEGGLWSSVWTAVEMAAYSGMVDTWTACFAESSWLLKLMVRLCPSLMAIFIFFLVSVH